MTWNVGGAKFLSLEKDSRAAYQDDLNRQLNKIVDVHHPDFILFQEVVQYEDSGVMKDFLQIPKGYHYKPSMAIDTLGKAHPDKWQTFRERGKWPQHINLAQGYGIMWRENISHRPIWDIETIRQGPELDTEEIHLDTGLYTGDRDTEPRLAVVSQFLWPLQESQLSLFLVNLHLTTIKGEREGMPEKDERGTHIRMAQIDIVMHGIVSRYNEWLKRDQQRTTTNLPIWVLAGDLNCIPESVEIERIKRMNFIDLTPDKGTGTKASGLRATKASITLDYIFAGPNYKALDPYLANAQIRSNPKPIYEAKISDHFPVIAEIPVCIPEVT